MNVILLVIDNVVNARKRGLSLKEKHVSDVVKRTPVV